ncbi:Mitochondrial-processing peptidase subunit alpha [Steccherinum ochraceum]|uniref:Alpha-MPP n=1 Tax=Steccherinum ochraceum TaxID=92696 RepID=A0A4R0RUG7_9APHY|nr:Mitochondrial-processing peptidase subunit alpha [Steccherinum ochraceum]
MRRAATSALRRSVRPRRQLHNAAASNPAGPSTVQVTTLPNKIRVATESTPGHFSSLGLYVDAGSRYEDPSNSGVSHFLDRMAFKTTTTRSDLDMSTDMDKLGGQIFCSSSRETIMYQSSHFHRATPLAMSLIADTVSNAAFLPEELLAQRDAARYEIREVEAKPEMILPEVLHEVAFDNKGLGNPLLCPEDRIDLVDEPAMRGFMKEWYRPERMVIAGAGMQHEELVELADKYFTSFKAPVPSTSTSAHAGARAGPAPSHFLPGGQQPPSIYKSLTRAASSYLYPASSVTPPDPTLFGARTGYTGGHKFIHDPNAEFNHVYLAFEGVGIHDEDVYTLATMQVLLGGGGSFSAGGPGKGMYSRLYTHILNNYPQIDHCSSFHHIYKDTSLFGLFASFLPNAHSHRHMQGNTPAQILPHLIHQLSLLLYTPFPRSELDRAKNQLKSSLVMALESRSVEVEDLGRQMLVHGRKVPVEEMLAKIDEVDEKRVREVAARVFGQGVEKSATVVVMGREDVGDWRGALRKYGVGGGSA